VSKLGVWSKREWLQQIRARCEEVGGCWVWTGTVTRHGAPRWTVTRDLQVRVHRRAWEVVVGPIAPGHVLVNQCGEPRCCRPAHYVCMSKGDHMRSELAAGRGVRGPLLGLAVARSWRKRADRKMSPERAALMRARRAEQPTPSIDVLAHEFGVSRATAWYVVSGRRWVPPSPFDALRRAA